MAQFEAEYAADGTAVDNKNLGFLRDPAFDAAWQRVRDINMPYWPNGTPDVRWRMHMCVWAARCALRVPGDFVDCGVNTGLFMSMICALTSLPSSGKRALLFDTFSGIPVDSVPEEEKEGARGWNAHVYKFDSYEVAREVFAPYPNIHLIRGVLPDSLSLGNIDRIAYLNIDLNSASAEIACAEALWPKLSPGAVVILDDYAFQFHESQYERWNAFADARGIPIATLPTGQGLILIPPR